MTSHSRKFSDFIKEGTNGHGVGLLATLPPSKEPASRRLAELDVRNTLLRECMLKLGLGVMDVGIGPDGAPSWPDGLCGSITHTEHLCGVATARSRDVPAIGLDIESRFAVEEDLWHYVLTKDEQRAIKRLPAGTRQEMSTVIFSAKEAVFKMQYPLTRT